MDAARRDRPSNVPSATPARQASASPSAATRAIFQGTPAAQATTIDLSTATTKGTNARPADGFSSVPYCEVFWENANGANGKKYAVQVYYRQDNKQPMHVSVFEVTTAWGVFDNNNGATITFTPEAVEVLSPSTRHLFDAAFIHVLVRRLHAAHEQLAHPRRIL